MAERPPSPDPTCRTKPPGPARPAAGSTPAESSARAPNADPLVRLVRALARQAAQEALARPDPPTPNSLEDLP